MRHLLTLLLALPLAAAEYQYVSTNLSLSTNVFVSAVGEKLALQGQPVVVSMTLRSSTNHFNNTVKAFVQFTADGTNWTRTNEVNTLVGTTLDGQTNSTIASNFVASGFSAARIASVVSSTVTNVLVTNISLGTWHLQK